MCHFRDTLESIKNFEEVRWVCLDIVSDVVLFEKQATYE